VAEEIIKVHELSQKGIIREVGGYYGAMYKTTHPKIIS